MAIGKKILCILLFLVIYVFPSWTLFSHAGDRSHQGRVTLLEDHKYYEAVISGIRKSRKEIIGCFFIFKVAERKNDLPMGIIRELIAAHRRGVAVSLQLEQSAPGRGAENSKTAALLTAAGIKIRFDAPETTTHVKAMVIDSRYVYIGSHNLTQSALKYNNELSIMVDSAELAEEITTYLESL